MERSARSSPSVTALSTSPKRSGPDFSTTRPPSTGCSTGTAGSTDSPPRPGGPHRAARPAHRTVHRSPLRAPAHPVPRAARRADDAAAGRGRRLRRLLLVDPPRHEPRAAVPSRRRGAPAELAPPARGLPRPLRHRRRRRDADIVRPSGCGSSTARRSTARPSALDIELEVGSSSARRRRSARPIDVDRCRGAPLRPVPGERLVGPRHPGLRVPAARPVPGQELRHLDLAVDRHPRRARAVPRRAAGAGSAPVADHLAHRRRRGLRPPPRGASCNGACGRDRRSQHRSFADMYWTPAQQLAHLTANGASVRAGDLFASGTVSGPTRGSEGSLIELTWNGERPLELPDGTSRTFLLRRRPRRAPRLGGIRPGDAHRPRHGSRDHRASPATRDRRSTCRTTDRVGDVPRSGTRISATRPGTVTPRS